MRTTIAISVVLVLCSASTSAQFTGRAEYPPDALRAHEQGRVIVELAISDTGQVTNCTVQSSSGFDSLDQATCKIMSRQARFHPAKNSDGQPIASTLRVPMTWRLPK